ncbi:sacsin N-terminal ATP-binding-like domain-containing protein [Gordonia sp. NPDC058843]|uniref:sacsin N-terminal ATP-binding-like domain-containing protein n=1 Tax=Gordonia sp. NPDC058843 TaxID=3346648 RepID=UPI0036A0A1BE
MSDDPFGTAVLRSSMLDAWASSPTRLAEDAAAESDLVTVGYRDRLLTELAANAADAASAAGIDGRLAVWTDGPELHVANTGAPLTDAGVRSLAALRVSAKTSGDPGDRQIGRFGVGFTATATVADRIEIRSRTGSVIFDRADTLAAVRAAGITRATDADVPVLRLVWPTDRTPATGFDTEVVLHLREEPGPLLDTMLVQAPDLVVELTALQRITVGDVEVSAERSAGPDVDDDAARSVVTTVSVSGGHASADVPSTRRWLEVVRGGTRWLVDADGEPTPDGDVLRAPTPTDIELSLPCRCITDLALTPDRRHLHPRAEIGNAAAGYVDLVRLVEPVRRVQLVPELHLARNPDDARLIEAVRRELRDAAWLPAADGADLVPPRAVMLVGLTDQLAETLGELFGDLIHPDLSLTQHLPALGRLGVSELGLAELAERLVGVEREPSWWHDLYDALAPLVSTGREVEELGALPIPRSDGRMAIGVRGLFVSDRISTPMRWIPTVHPEARHELLTRLGIADLTVAEAVGDPALRGLVEDADFDAADSGDDGLAAEVCAVLRADPDAPVPSWLSALALPDADGAPRPADELLLPGSPLLEVLVDDHPFGVVAAEVVAECGAEQLRRIGVGWGFVTVDDDLPVAPEHDLPDEEDWWETLADAPEKLSAVRDLDLIDEERWPQALTMMATDERIRPLLADRTGYTAWWLRRHAEIDGLLLGEYRSPSDDVLENIIDPLDHPHADELTGALARLEPDSADDATLLLTRLADRGRVISSGAAVSVHEAIVAACRRGVVDPHDVEVPERVRTVAGVVDDRAVVVDRPWFLQALADDEAVLAGPTVTSADAETLATLLDLPLATEEYSATVSTRGDAVSWAHPDVVRFGALRGVEVPRAEVRLHDELWIALRGNGVEREVRVEWWVDAAGVTHLERRSRR